LRGGVMRSFMMCSDIERRLMRSFMMCSGIERGRNEELHDVFSD